MHEENTIFSGIKLMVRTKTAFFEKGEGVHGIDVYE